MPCLVCDLFVCRRGLGCHKGSVHVPGWYIQVCALVRGGGGGSTFLSRGGGETYFERWEGGRGGCSFVSRWNGCPDADDCILLPLASPPCQNWQASHSGNIIT